MLLSSSETGKEFDIPIFTGAVLFQSNSPIETCGSVDYSKEWFICLDRSKVLFPFQCCERHSTNWIPFTSVTLKADNLR